MHLHTACINICPCMLGLASACGTYMVTLSATIERTDLRGCEAQQHLETPPHTHTCTHTHSCHTYTCIQPHVGSMTACIPRLHPPPPFENFQAPQLSSPMWLPHAQLAGHKHNRWQPPHSGSAYVRWLKDASKTAPLAVSCASGFHGSRNVHLGSNRGMAFKGGCGALWGPSSTKVQHAYTAALGPQASAVSGTQPIHEATSA